MSVDRVKINKLAPEWGAEIGIPPMDLARALLHAAFAGEFDELPPTKRVTVFDDRRLIHKPVDRTPKYEVFIDAAIRGGWAWVHKDAVIAFASDDGRGYPLPARWSEKAANEKLFSVKASKPDAAAAALRTLFPEGRPHHSRQALVDRVSAALGETVSMKTLERAMAIAWATSAK